MEVFQNSEALSNDYDEKALFNNQEMVDGLMTKGVAVLLLIVAVITVGINLGVIIRVIKLNKKGDLKPAFYYIGNLAVSDFVVGSYIFISFCIDLTQFSMKWRNKCCGFLTAVVVTACQETICTIMLIAIDKYIFICHGISYPAIVTKRKVWIFIVLSWGFSLLIGFLPAFGMHEDEWKVCNFLLYINKGFAAILFITTVALPLAIIVSLYSIILSLAIKISKRKAAAGASSSSNVTSLVLMSSRSKSSKSSNSTLSSRFSTSDSSSSSTPIKRTTRKKRPKLSHINQPEGEPQITETVPLKSTTSESLSDDKTRTMPIVIELQETDIVTPKETDSSDESDSKKKAKVKTSNVRFETSKEGSYYLFQISPDAEGKFTPIRDQSTVDSVSLKRYTQYDDDGKVVLNSSRKTSQATSKAKFMPPLKSPENDYSNSSSSESETNNTGSETGETVTLKDVLTRRKSYYKRIATETKNKVQFLQKCRAIKIVFLILLCFILTYVPFVTATLSFKVQKEKSVSLFKALNNFLYFAVVLNSLFNPFVYAYGYKDFRIKTKRFKGIFAKERKVRI